MSFFGFIRAAKELEWKKAREEFKFKFKMGREKVRERKRERDENSGSKRFLKATERYCSARRQKEVLFLCDKFYCVLLATASFPSFHAKNSSFLLSVSVFLLRLSFFLFAFFGFLFNCPFPHSLQEENSKGCHLCLGPRKGKFLSCVFSLGLFL